MLLPVGKMCQCAPQMPFWQIAPGHKPVLTPAQGASRQLWAGIKAARKRPLCSAQKKPSAVTPGLNEVSHQKALATDRSGQAVLAIIFTAGSALASVAGLAIWARLASIELTIDSIALPDDTAKVTPGGVFFLAS